MKAIINKQSDKKSINFNAGDIIIIESTSGATYTLLVTKCLSGMQEWLLVNLDGEAKWTDPKTKAELIANLEKHSAQGKKITVIPSREAVLQLNI